MKLKQFFKFICVATLSALVYISMQMQIIALAYQNNHEEKEIRNLIEENGHIAYSIFSLKSANNLGVKMLAENSDMQFADPNNIVRVSSFEDDSDKQVTAGSNKITKKIAPLLSLLTSSSQAEARTQE